MPPPPTIPGWLDRETNTLYPGAPLQNQTQIKVWLRNVARAKALGYTVDPDHSHAREGDTQVQVNIKTGEITVPGAAKPSRQRQPEPEPEPEPIAEEQTAPRRKKTLMDERLERSLHKDDPNYAERMPMHPFTKLMLIGICLVVVVIGGLVLIAPPDGSISNTTTSIGQETSTGEQTAVIVPTEAPAEEPATQAPAPTAAPSADRIELNIFQQINKLDGLTCKSGQVVNIVITTVKLDQGLSVSYGIGGNTTKPVVVSPGGEHYQDIVVSDPNLPNEPHPCGVVVHYDGTMAWAVMDK